MPIFDDLITEREPPPKRKARTDGPLERHFSEAAVMLAFAIHIFDTEPSVEEIELHPDGEHGKRFDIRGWLERHGFAREQSLGKTNYGGVYKKSNRTITVTPTSGLGDVVAKVNDGTIVAECKGGIVNTCNAGQKSRLRKGLCETIGLLMTRSDGSERQIAVVPHTEDTRRVAERMIDRTKAAGIEIALVSSDGEVKYMG